LVRGTDHGRGDHVRTQIDKMQAHGYVFPPTLPWLHGQSWCRPSSIVEGGAMHWRGLAAGGQSRAPGVPAAALTVATERLGRARASKTASRIVCSPRRLRLRLVRTISRVEEGKEARKSGLRPCPGRLGVLCLVRAVLGLGPLSQTGRTQPEGPWSASAARRS